MLNIYRGLSLCKEYFLSKVSIVGSLRHLFLTSPEKKKKTHSYSLPTCASWAPEVFFHLLMPCLFTFSPLLLTFECPSGTERLACRGNRSQKAAGQQEAACPFLSLWPAGPLSPGTRRTWWQAQGSHDSCVLPNFRSLHAKPSRQLL